MEPIILVGLATGYLTHALMWPSVAPGWWKKWQERWRVTFGPKPFNCAICMSFWIALILWGGYRLFATLTSFPVLGFYDVWVFGLQVFACSCISALVTGWLGNLNIMVVQ